MNYLILIKRPNHLNKSLTHSCIYHIWVCMLRLPFGSHGIYFKIQTKNSLGKCKTVVSDECMGSLWDTQVMNCWRSEVTQLWVEGIVPGSWTSKGLEKTKKEHLLSCFSLSSGTDLQWGLWEQALRWQPILSSITYISYVPIRFLFFIILLE